MQSEGRRAFLKGRRPPSTPWERFGTRLRNAVAGEVIQLDATSDDKAARLVVKQPSDVHHALRLCREFGVGFALDGVPLTASQHGPVLWVRPGPDVAACQRLEPGSSRWFVQPGCLLGQLEAAGLRAFADMPAHLTVAAWLADRTQCNWPTGRTVASGIVHASALLADGITVSLGAFGVENRKALDSLRLQTLIPALFQLANTPDARLCLERAAWPARYRLDALIPAPGQTINLAHLLLGHGGDLAWVEWVVIDENLLDPKAAAESLLEMPRLDFFEAEQGTGWGAGMDAGSGPCDEVNLARAAQELDAAVKTLFDPEGTLPHPGQML